MPPASRLHKTSECVEDIGTGATPVRRRRICGVSVHQPCLRWRQPHGENKRCAQSPDGVWAAKGAGGTSAAGDGWTGGGGAFDQGFSRRVASAPEMGGRPAPGGNHLSPYRPRFLPRVVGFLSFR